MTFSRKFLVGMQRCRFLQFIFVLCTCLISVPLPSLWPRTGISNEEIDWREGEICDMTFALWMQRDLLYCNYLLYAFLFHSLRDSLQFSLGLIHRIVCLKVWTQFPKSILWIIQLHSREIVWTLKNFVPDLGEWCGNMSLLILLWAESVKVLFSARVFLNRILKLRKVSHWLIVLFALFHCTNQANSSNRRDIPIWAVFAYAPCDKQWCNDEQGSTSHD